jgi:hypothetical protein
MVDRSCDGFEPKRQSGKGKGKGTKRHHFFFFFEQTTVATNNVLATFCLSPFSLTYGTHKAALLSQQPVLSQKDHSLPTHQPTNQQGIQLQLGNHNQEQISRLVRINMDTLVILFPHHSRTQLQECLERAGGAIEQAIEALFDVPAPAGSSTSAPLRPTSVQVLPRSNPHTNTTKRQKQAPAPTSNGVVDLTLSDEDDRENKIGPIGGVSRHLYKATIEIEDDTLDYDDFPRPQPSTSAPGKSNMPSFEDFHQQEQNRIEEKRLKDLQAEEQRRALVDNFVAHAQVMFDNISTPYLERLIADNRPKIASDEELIDTCIETIFKTNGKYPKAKRKRDHEDGDEDGDSSGSEEDFGLGGSNSYQGSSTSQANPRAKRDFNDCSVKMNPQYLLDS